MRRSPLLALLLTSACATLPPPPPPPPELQVAEQKPEAAHYPPTRKRDLVEQQFGVAVADPYRWLENDVRNDAEVRAWVTAENEVTDKFLAMLPLRAKFKARMIELYDYERFGLPVKKGDLYFYTHNSGLQNQSVLFLRQGVQGEARQLIDPNGWSADGATALAEWNPSEDGKLLAYAIQDGGTDWRTVRVLDVATGNTLPDELKWLKYSGYVSWAKDGKGFYYSRFPAPEAGATFQNATLNERIYFHRLGAPQSEDKLVYATPDSPKLGHSGYVTDDGRWLVISTSEAGDENDVHVIDLKKPGAKPVALFTGLKHQWNFVGNEGSRFFFSTDEGAPLKRVVAVDVGHPAAAPVAVIPEAKEALDDVDLVGGKLIAAYLVDAKSEVRVYNLAGKRASTIPLPGLGTVGGFGGKDTDPETFFSFASYNRPTTIYRYDAATGQATEWAVPKLTFDPETIAVEQRFYASKDGTRVPMFIVRRKDSKGPAPTMLYGYGGFNVSMTPGFSPANIAWVEQGGTFVVVNIRGGSEYGNAWHDAGRLQNKQNVFDDFIAAGEYLKASGIAAPHGLSAIGRSNGGLLVGAVTNQRPDLFDAVAPGVGVMDMLRFDKFTAGRYWVDDYGHPDKEQDFRTLFAYSPYHNIKGGKPYPPLIAVTADTDDRVVPGHSFKYIAKLQSTDGVGDAPHLIRIDVRSGHGSGKPITKIIEEYSDVYAFLGHFTGLDSGGSSLTSADAAANSAK
jgi:prolyl oligopeptidase